MVDERGHTPIPRALVLANGDLGVWKHRNDEWNWVVCADGGARHALQIGIKPDLIVGDFDSLDDHIRSVFAGVETRRFSPDKDKTDTHLAVDMVLDWGAREVVVAGGIGTRIDHSLANLDLLLLIHERGASGWVTDGDQRVYLVHGRLTLKGPPGAILSLHPITQTLKGVSLSGLRWELNHVDLSRGETRTVSNEFVAGRDAVIDIGEGLAFVVITSSSR